MNLGDPELEFIDPTPNVYELFLYFDKLFFSTKLANRAVVRWSKRMYSSAGVCSYEGRGGLCVIALSEPLLKLRPRKDFIETLLHEMIHAFLFVTNMDRDHDGHGPTFKSHMYRINKSAGLNITIYHDFHEEVALYKTHWWRCDGRCQNMKPFFGIVRRTRNTPPGPTDNWWRMHMKNCGGSFVKIREPEKKTTKKTKTPAVRKSKGDITKYINNNNNKEIANSTSKIIETVRNVWVNKQLPNLDQKPIQPKAVQASNSKNNISSANKVLKPSKHKANDSESDLPSPKLKKIDDYFRTTAITLLKDVYGKDFVLGESNNKIIAVKDQIQKKVDCPICSQKVHTNEINKHIDECLNKDIIEMYTKDTKNPSTESEIGLSDEIDTKVIVSSASTIVDLSNTNIAKSSDIAAVKEEKPIDLVNTPSKCFCCGNVINKTMADHLDECLAFFDSNTTVPQEGASTSFANDTIVIDSDEEDTRIFDETLTLNATGTKSPCPCCLQMIEISNMNKHLDVCLS